MSGVRELLTHTHLFHRQHRARRAELSIPLIELRAEYLFWHKADISRLSSNVRFWGQSGHHPNMPSCPLLTQSGHQRLKIAAPQLDPEPHFAVHKSLL